MWHLCNILSFMYIPLIVHVHVLRIIKVYNLGNYSVSWAASHKSWMWVWKWEDSFSGCVLQCTCTCTCTVQVRVGICIDCTVYLSKIPHTVCCMWLCKQREPVNYADNLTGRLSNNCCFSILYSILLVALKFQDFTSHQICHMNLALVLPHPCTFTCTGISHALLNPFVWIELSVCDRHLVLKLANSAHIMYSNYSYRGQIGERNASFTMPDDSRSFD